MNSGDVDYADWAASMIEPLGARAMEAEALRELPPSTLDDARGSGMFTMAMPREMGGGGRDLHELATTTRLLAHGCVSSAWTLSFFALHNWFLARGPQAMRDAVLGESGYALMPCPLAPTGTAEPVPDGHVVTGTWQWATGIQHADWVMVHAVVARDDTFETRFFVVPVSDVTVDDVWRTSGMRATGSNTIRLESVHVPHARSMLASDFLATDPPGSHDADHPFLRSPVAPVLALVAAAPALGGAEAAVELFQDRLASRVLAYTLGDRQAEQPAGQIRLAEAQATVRAARLVWEDAIDQTATIGDGAGSLVIRGRLRLAAAHTVRLSIQAVEGVLEASGASVHFEDSPLQRIARDLLTLRGHVVFDWDRTAQLAGKLELGFDPAPGDMV